RPVPAAARTLHAPDIAVELQRSAAAGSFMQTVHVLGDQGEIGLGGLEMNQGSMSRVGLGFSDQSATPVIPLPNQARIFRERLGRCQIFGFVLLPETIGAAEGRDAALGGDAGAGEDDDRGSGANPMSSLFHNRIIAQRESGGFASSGQPIETQPALLLDHGLP